jgi:hypothetical protein
MLRKKHATENTQAGVAAVTTKNEEKDNLYDPKPALAPLQALHQG